MEKVARTMTAATASGSLRAALNAGAAALRRYRPGKTGEEQAALLEAHAQQLRTDASVLYEQAVRYLLANGWRRESLGNGWWWREGMNEALLEEALTQQFEADGLDLRTMLPDEPQEFWG